MKTHNFIQTVLLLSSLIGLSVSLNAHASCSWNMMWMGGACRAGESGISYLSSKLPSTNSSNCTTNAGLNGTWTNLTEAGKYHIRVCINYPGQNPD